LYEIGTTCRLTESKKDNGPQGILIGLFVILIIATAIVSNYETDCSDNEACFDRAFYTCTKAKVIGEQNENIFEYRILEKKMKTV